MRRSMRGFQTVPLTPEYLAEALYTITSNPHLAQKDLEGYKNSPNFTWSVTSKSIWGECLRWIYREKGDEKSLPPGLNKFNIGHPTYRRIKTLHSIFKHNYKKVLKHYNTLRDGINIAASDFQDPFQPSPRCGGVGWKLETLDSSTPPVESINHPDLNNQLHEEKDVHSTVICQSPTSVKENVVTQTNLSSTQLGLQIMNQNEIDVEEETEPINLKVSNILPETNMSSTDELSLQTLNQDEMEAGKETNPIDLTVSSDQINRKNRNTISGDILLQPNCSQETISTHEESPILAPSFYSLRGMGAFEVPKRRHFESQFEMPPIFMYHPNHDPVAYSTFISNHMENTTFNTLGVANDAQMQWFIDTSNMSKYDAGLSTEPLQAWSQNTQQPHWY